MARGTAVPYLSQFGSMTVCEVAKRIRRRDVVRCQRHVLDVQAEVPLTNFPASVRWLLAPLRGMRKRPSRGENAYLAVMVEHGDFHHVEMDRIEQ